MVIVAHPGSVAMCPASHPTVPDFSCGFQFHFSSGTRSSVLRVFFISSSNSPSIDWPIVMVCLSEGDSSCGFQRGDLRRIKGEMSSEFLFLWESHFCPARCKRGCPRILLCCHAPEQNSLMPHQFTTSYTKDARDLLRYYKKLGDRAIEQCPDADLFTTLDPESNSIAIIIKHMAGNMRSRWMDFLTTDGEKPDRNRDSEFEAPPQTSAGLVALWEAGWKICLDSLDALTDDDLTRTITVRTEPHSVMQAINRQVGHYAHHVGQIVFLAKHFAGANWQTLSVPKR